LIEFAYKDLSFQATSEIDSLELPSNI
jgi:hypothetical protein